ncbi:protein FAM13C [Osmerus mordax]|uniref:protein FAM13C n=1 Tax=Osmerus mordax TaxID=8014 RepID=UPI00350F47DF
MFCFCLQSSLLKLQALEGDSCSSLGSSPDNSPPALTPSQTQTLSPALDGKQDSQALCHSYPGRENGPPADLMSFLCPPQSEGESPRSNPPQQSPGPSRLLHHITDGNSPLPSPRCHSLSQRFNSDPDTAPSPPSSQQFILARGLDRADLPEESKDSSVPLLTKHIQTLKKRIRKFEERFELEMNYKPSHNDKSANPEMFKLMTDLAKSRKQLKELKLKQSVFEGREYRSDGQTEICRYGSVQQGASEPQHHKPSLEETVEALLRRLREKRHDLGLPDNMREMTQRQMALEKMTLQKCLLYFESLHGRPGTKQERILVKPLYDRYQMIKHLLCTSPITTIEEEEDSDEENVQHCPTPPCQRLQPLTTEEESDRESDTAFVSPLDEVKAVRLPAITMANLHEASRSELVVCLRETRVEKKRRRKALREFEEEFFRQTGRTAQKEDRTPMAEEYHEYKNLKAKLRLLEVLLSKQETTTKTV